jgi:hypothetical protein
VFDIDPDQAGKYTATYEVGGRSSLLALDLGRWQVPGYEKQ